MTAWVIQLDREFDRTVGAQQPRPSFFAPHRHPPRCEIATCDVAGEHRATAVEVPWRPVGNSSKPLQRFCLGERRLARKQQAGTSSAFGELHANCPHAE